MSAEAMHGKTVKVGDRVAVVMSPGHIGTVTEVHTFAPGEDADDWCLIQYDNGRTAPSAAWCLLLAEAR